MEYFEFIQDLSKKAGEVIKEGFYGKKDVKTKGGTNWDFVTDYDTRVEQLLISSIKEKYPEHQFIGEESSADTKSRPVLTDAPTWIIDPIDGTNNYIRGFPLSCLSVALALEKQVVLGVVYNPMINQFFTAVKHGGAFLNGERIQTSQVPDIKSAVVVTEPSLAKIPFIKDRTLSRLQAITTQARGVLSIGSVAMSLCYVANGAMDGFFMDGPHCWDVAAGVLILEEAGGHVCSPTGGEYSMFSRTIVSAGNKALAEEIVEMLKEGDAKHPLPIIPE